MLNLTNEQKRFLRDNFEQAEAMIQSDRLDDILLPLDALITYQGFGKDYLLTAWGSEAQRIYDDIYTKNSR